MVIAQHIAVAQGTQPTGYPGNLVMRHRHPEVLAEVEHNCRGHWRAVALQQPTRLGLFRLQGGHIAAEDIVHERASLRAGDLQRAQAIAVASF